MIDFVNLPQTEVQMIAEYLKKHPKTNADRIRSMTDEELANFIFDCVACDDCPIGSTKCKREFAKCHDAALDCLKQETKE